ncbi:MAG: hypothetical protein HY904_18785 [Deltaproteobacteria bacterium]|nr:hypothetical protein [Deltaproteobacteria bacterium]
MTALRALSWCVRALMVPLDICIVWGRRAVHRAVPPRYQVRGACAHGGGCCRRLLVVEEPFLVRPVLGRLARFWLERIYPMRVTANAVLDPETGEYHRILECRNRVDGRCREYALRPRACREWPLSDGERPAVLFAGCGFRVVDRWSGTDVDVSRRRGTTDTAPALLAQWKGDA